MSKLENDIVAQAMRIRRNMTVVALAGRFIAEHRLCTREQAEAIDAMTAEIEHDLTVLAALVDQVDNPVLAAQIRKVAGSRPGILEAEG